MLSFKRILLCFFSLPVVFCLSAQAATYTVTNCADSGAGSLRQAITDANGAAGSHTIVFDIPNTDPGYTTEAGVSFWRIQPASPLPGVTRNAVVIDGRTQTTNQGNTNTLGPEIVLDGSVTTANGISIEANYCTVEGLVINNFINTFGVEGDGGDGVCLKGSSNEVKGNYIGTDATGTVAAKNYLGVFIGTNAKYNRIGGRASGEGNVISGNSSKGVSIHGALYTLTSNEVKGNYIGLNAAGTAVVTGSQQQTGVTICGGRNKIGGGLTGEGNVISGNSSYQIYINDGNSNEVKGNYIGTNASGTAEVGYGFSGGIYLGDNVVLYNKIGGSVTGEGNVISGQYYWGIYIDAGGSNEVKGNYIGTNASGAALGNRLGGIYLESSKNMIGPGNVIAYNGIGLLITGGAVAARDTITQNSFHHNYSAGIVINAASNHGIQPPVITFESATVLSGTATAGATVEVFLGDLGYSGLGEGKTYLGETLANGSGNWSFSYDFTGLPTVVATATNAQGDTSAFSATSEARLFVTNTNDSGTGSLRQAITDANMRSMPPTIVFDMPASDPGYIAEGSGYVWRIQPTSALPSVTRDAVVIDGTTQTANRGDTNPLGPEVVLDGTLAGVVNGISIGANYCTVEGLAIGKFSGTDQAGIYINGASNEVKGNYIGTNASGTTTEGNYYGIYAEGDNNRIGGGGGVSGEGNVVSGNSNNGIYILSGVRNEIMGNYIGVNAAGTAAVANGGYGIRCSSSLDKIGSSESGKRNVISGNSSFGIRLGYRSEVKGNYIGTDASGLAAIGNTQGGIYAASSRIMIGGSLTGEGNVISGNGSYGIYFLGVTNTGSTVEGNYIGTTATGEGALGNGGVGIYAGSRSIRIGPNNVIAYNKPFISAGVGVEMRYTTTVYSNTITQNSIHDNGRGIMIPLANNRGIQPPVITLETESILAGTATPDATVEVFLTGAYNPDPLLGSPEGRTYLGSTQADGSGNWSFSYSFTQGATVTATATDTLGDTSQFSVGADLGGTVVTNTNDSGWGSLRQAILNANAIAGSHTIAFNIPNTDPGYTTEAGVSFWKIQPTSALPGVTRDATVIDGTTQTANQGNTNPDGPEIVIFGDEEEYRGLTINGAQACTIEGLVISYADCGIYITGGSGNEILGNYLGTEPSGTTAWGNGTGVEIDGSFYNKIGDGTVAGRNVISGNYAGDGIYVNGGSSNEVLGNYIGTNASGTAFDPMVGNNFVGVEIDGSFYNKIGDGTVAGRNVISGNYTEGIVVYDSSSNEVRGNYIGTAADGVSALGNGGESYGGVYIFYGSWNLIGPGNVIAYNSMCGVYVTGDELSVSNTITQNSLHDNYWYGIYLDGTSNREIPAPEITAAYPSGLTGTATAGATVEVFATGDPDSSGYGEGRTYLGTTIATGGVWSIGLTLTAGTTLTATATDTLGDTSMFSYNATVEVVPTTEVTNTDDSGTGSLRQVMSDVIGGVVSGKTITFNIPTDDPGYTTEAGVSFWKIQPTSA
ncbi:MAG: right-handed parallel beta-helix repeat-containing protein, partial [Candidatus Saganbacteria bacterium]|nr:right-handed parallel beta-helix repeat-containing protein [Candidatus Saganbacteria bacterium]